MSKKREDYKVLCGTCPDEQCHAKLFFPAYDKSIECTGCGQRHEKSTLQNIAEVTNPSVALHNILKNILLGNVKPKKGPDNVKVLGLSNYVCKLVSPILTSYGMDKKTGRAQLLTELGQPAVFDCGKILGDRAFLIEEENLCITGYGRDKTGSTRFLSGTLDIIKEVNNGEERLVPIHADGDGHCLVHAVSRALVGRELFWHALRVNLLNHFNDNLDKYKELFKEFVDTVEWSDIVQECDPQFCPRDGEPLGLRNIHVFGLANVLKRPIILLDSIEGMQSKGDYSGVFLPGLVKPDECKSKDGSLNKPLCIAWSSEGRNHYIPLVGIKGKPSPRLPRYMIQKTWGMPSILLDKYIDLDEHGHCIVGGDKCLSDKYIRHLVSSMGDIFYEKYGVQQQLVADVHQFMYKTSGIVGVQPDEVLKTTQRAVRENKLYRCLTCDGVMEYLLSSEWFRRGGSLYNLAIQTQGDLKPDKRYQFPMQGVVCTYDAEKDVLVPDMSKSQLSICSFCQGSNVRLVNGDSSIKYENGDRTMTPAPGGRCTCGFKHYWEGKEYDNLPEIFPVSLEWNGQVVAEKVAWFQYETDDSMNSNVYEVSQKLVQKHFPGEFGSERLVQQVVNTILRRTAAQKKDPEKSVVNPYSDDNFHADTASKIILTGHAHKSLHKEELCKSEKEKQVKKRITAEAPKQQQRKSADISSGSIPKSSPKKSKSFDAGVQSKTTSDVTMTTSATASSSPKHTGAKKVKIASSDGQQMPKSKKCFVVLKRLAMKNLKESGRVDADKKINMRKKCFVALKRLCTRQLKGGKFITTQQKRPSEEVVTFEEGLSTTKSDTTSKTWDGATSSEPGTEPAQMDTAQTDATPMQYCSTSTTKTMYTPYDPAQITPARTKELGCKVQSTVEPSRVDCHSKKTMDLKTSLELHKRELLDIWQSPYPENQPIRKVGTFSLSISDLKSLESLLTDEVMDAYLHLLAKQYPGTLHLSSIVLHSIFNNRNEIHQYVLQENFQDYECVFGALHEQGDHWTFIAVLPRQKKIVYCNPLGELFLTEHNILYKWYEFVNDRSYIKSSDLPDGKWEIQSVPHSKQQDSQSCGIYVLKMAECLLMNDSLLFDLSSVDLEDYRKHIGSILLSASDEQTNDERLTQSPNELTSEKMTTFEEEVGENIVIPDEPTTAGGNVVIPDEPTTAGGNVAIPDEPTTAGGNVVIPDEPTTAGGNVAIPDEPTTAGGNVAIPDEPTTAGGNVVIPDEPTTAGGNVVIPDEPTTAGGNVVIPDEPTTAGGNVAIPDEPTTAGGNVVIPDEPTTAGGNVVIPDEPTTAGGNVVIPDEPTTAGGNVVIPVDIPLSDEEMIISNSQEIPISCENIDETITIYGEISESSEAEYREIFTLDRETSRSPDAIGQAGNIISQTQGENNRMSYSTTSQHGSSTSCLNKELMKQMLESFQQQSAQTSKMLVSLTSNIEQTDAGFQQQAEIFKMLQQQQQQLNSMLSFGSSFFLSQPANLPKVSTSTNGCTAGIPRNMPDSSAISVSSDLPVYDIYMVGSSELPERKINDNGLIKEEPFVEDNCQEMLANTCRDNDKNINGVTKMKKKKKYPKRPCPYCGKFRARLTRHLKKKHSDEEDVSQALKLPRHSRDQVFCQLKRKGYSKFNIEKLKEEECDYSTLLKERKERKTEIEENTLVMCSHCKGFFIRAHMTRHKNNCFVAEATALLPTPLNIELLKDQDTKLHEGFVEKILPSFLQDEVGNFCRSDSFIKHFGNQHYRKVLATTDKPQQQRLSIMKDMRQLANLFFFFKQEVEKNHNESVESSRDMFDVKYFQSLEDAINVMSAKEDGGLKSGCKKNTGFLLKKALCCLKGICILEDNQVGRDKIRQFSEYLDYKWIDMFHDANYNCIKNRQLELRRPKNLPIETEVKQLRDFVVKNIKSLSDQKENLDSTQYVFLRDLVVCRLTLLNARRGGEPTRLTLKEWEDADSDVWIDKARTQNLSDSERLLMGNFKLAYQSGKCIHQMVPSLIPEDTWVAIRKLKDVNIRKSAGVLAKNPFLFPNVQHSDCHTSGWHAVKNVCKLAGLSKAINATSMRHRASTIYAGLNVSDEDRDIFYQHMGHTKEINKNVYQCPISIQEITTVGKFLNVLDKDGNDVGSVMAHNTEVSSQDTKNKARKRKRPELEDEDYSEESDETSSNDELQEEDNSGSEGEEKGSCSKKKERSYYRWREADEKVVRDYFHNYITDTSCRGTKGSLPGRAAIRNFVKMNRNVLHDIKDLDKRCEIIRRKVMNDRKRTRDRHEKRMRDMTL